MAKGISVHIGLNRVDPNHYQDASGHPWEGILAGCINDAKAMQAIAEGQGFKTHVLLDDAATAGAVSDAITSAAEELHSGDIFFISYSGHGGQVPDIKGDDEEEDRLDETWCLFDRQFLDDELYDLWSKFAGGLRIFMLSDSCHSGTMAKDVMAASIMTQEAKRIRVMPEFVREGTYNQHKAEYQKIQKEHPLGDKVLVKAGVILISGCQDNQVSYDGEVNGKFTETLIHIWNNGEFKGSVTDFHKKINENMPFYQSPNFYKVGASIPEFEAQPPFLIGEGGEEQPECECCCSSCANYQPDKSKLPPPSNHPLLGSSDALKAAWEKHMKSGFENNDTMFKRTLGAFMKPYQLTVWLYALVFAVGIGLFITAAVIGLTRDTEGITAIAFGGLSVVTFIAFFIQQPLHALEENLEFITWLGTTFNTYWTRLMYMLDEKNIQKDLKAADDDFVTNIIKLINKHAALRRKRFVPKEPPADEEEETIPDAGVDPPEKPDKPDGEGNEPDTPDKPVEEGIKPE